MLLGVLGEAQAASAQGSPEIAIENLTKLARSDVSYPADDYYSFNRIKDAGQAPVDIDDFRIAKTHDTNTMRISNPGTAPLVITAITITHTDTNPSSPGPSYELPNGEDQALPLIIEAGESHDLEIAFIAINGSKRLIKDQIRIESNALNEPVTTATLHGIYMVIPREGNEIDLQSIFSVFGLQTSMNGDLRPREFIPTAADVEAGVHGDLVLAEYWQQADLSEPVYGTMLAVFNGQTSAARLIDSNGDIVGEPPMGMTSNRHWEQSIFPRDEEFGPITGSRSDMIVDDDGNRMPFRMTSNGFTTTGSPLSNPNKLGLRIYRALDRHGYAIPNTYLAAQDFVNTGCGLGEGQGNCDWQDTVLLFTNIEPIDPVLSPYTSPDDFTCDADAGVVRWTDAVKPKYWVYKSTDGGATYRWLGRTAGAPATATLTDPAPSIGATYRVHFRGIDQVSCTVSAEPEAPPAPFACDADGGVLSWVDAGAARYWVYKSTDGGATYRWLGRTAGAPATTTFTDPAPTIGAGYQVHFAGIDRVGCSITSEPAAPPPPFECASQLGVVTWTDRGQLKYWVYKSTDGGATYRWLGRTVGDPAPTTITDPAPTDAARYQVHYPGVPRFACTLID